VGLGGGGDVPGVPSPALGLGMDMRAGPQMGMGMGIGIGMMERAMGMERVGKVPNVRSREC